MENISYQSLSKNSYRNLQQIAKSLKLPSNVKKMYLIEMIIAKKHCTEEQLNEIITRVKRERQIQSQNKKKGKRVQGYEISSTSQHQLTNQYQSSNSPPIVGTPKRSYFLQYTPDVTIKKYQPKKSILKPIAPKLKESDRILRSYNSKKPNYGIIECKDTVLKIVKAQNPMQVSQEIRSSAVERSIPLNLSVSKNLPRKVLNASVCLKKLDMKIMQIKKNNQTPQKRQRTVSGIYPLKPSENTYYEYVPTVGFRRNDGKVAKINAMVEKPRFQQYNRPIKVTMQEVINRKVDNTIREFPKIPAINYKQSDDYQEHRTLAIDYKPQSLENETSTTYNFIDSQSNITETINTVNSYGINATQSYEKDSFQNDCGTNTLPTIGKYDLHHGTNNLQCNGKNTLNGNETNAFKGCVTNALPTHGPNITSFNSNTSEAMPILNTLESPTLNTFGTNTSTDVSVKDLQSENGNYTVYYHKKIRSEQIRRVIEREETLPRISEVFSQFNEVQYRSLTQPLYVQVSQESENFPRNPYQLNNENTSMLESLYNFKLQFIVNQPLLTIATTSNTKCVFSTTTAPTAVAHPPPVYNEYNNVNALQRVNQYNYNLEAETRLYDYMRTAEQERYRRDFTCHEVLSPASSMDTTKSQELGDNATIPEMVEDALELISQDGDYMERLGLDVRMQCILCDWAGAKIILEYHVKQTHQKEIQYKTSSDWKIVLTLGALVSHGIWLSNVIQYNENLYAVSAKYTEDCISVILTSLSEATTPKNGQITIYNKITGKPYTWQGEILPIPDTLPFTSSFNCLKLEITSLDLVPNSANLKLINKELKLVSDNKVVVGQPSLNDIEIVIHVSVFD